MSTKAQTVLAAFTKNKRLLNDREKVILKCYYGIGGDLRHTLQELGDRFKVTRERIRQIKAVALNKIGAEI